MREGGPGGGGRRIYQEYVYIFHNSELNDLKLKGEIWERVRRGDEDDVDM